MVLGTLLATFVLESIFAQQEYNSIYDTLMMESLETLEKNRQERSEVIYFSKHYIKSTSEQEI